MRLLLAAVLLLVSFASYGQTAILTCTPPTTYENGSPIGSATITYKFYRGAAQTGPFTLETRTSSTCGTTYSGLAVGTHWFVATATVAGVESVQTASVSKTVLPPKPLPPSGLTVQADLTAYQLIQSRDRVALLAVGTVAPGTACDSTQPVLDKFVVPRAAVTFAGSVQPQVVLASCG